MTLIFVLIVILIYLPIFFIPHIYTFEDQFLFLFLFYFIYSIYVFLQMLLEYLLLAVVHKEPLSRYSLVLFLLLDSN